MEEKQYIVQDGDVMEFLCSGGIMRTYENNI